MQESINALMVDVCSEENVSPEMVFLLFLLHFSNYSGLFEKNLGSRNLYVSRKQRMKISGVSLKRRGIFIGNHVEFLT